MVISRCSREIESDSDKMATCEEFDCEGMGYFSGGGHAGASGLAEPKCSQKTLSTFLVFPDDGWFLWQTMGDCSLASITTAAGRSTHCPGTLASITAAAGWSTQRCPWTLALIINIAAVS
ncbi:hypothetical protein ACOMHN_052349 [Nucella lapillus]